MIESIWFILWGGLWSVYFILDGYDLGIGLLMPVLGREEQDRRVLYNAIGPFWDGNEVWLVVAGGVTFAAFPGAYAVLFSALYTPLMLLLCCLMVRGISIEFRRKIDDPGWKRCWDVIFFASSLCVTFLFGVFFGNLFQGVPVDGEGILQGNIITLLAPYPLVCGLLFVLLFAVHGALWLAVRAVGGLHDRTVAVARDLLKVASTGILVFLVTGFFLTPLFRNYLTRPVLLLIIPVWAVGLNLTPYFLARGEFWKAWGGSALTILGTTMFGILGMYPALLPSSLSGEFSRTISNSASSPFTLHIMLGVALLVLPLVVLYQAWVHREFGYKIDEIELGKESSY